MRSIRTFRVVPNIPTQLEFVYHLAYNLWWSWNQDAVTLFSELEPELWEACDHNPVRLLGAVTQERLDELSRDEGFLAFMAQVKEQFDDYMQKPGTLKQSDATLEALNRPPGSLTSKPSSRWETTWYSNLVPRNRLLVGYFSAEFGIHPCLPIYSGGLGVLAGDHLKSASDLSVPLVGVGLAYHHGYFRQALTPEGWQQELYPPNDFNSMPMTLEYRHGKPVQVVVQIGERPVRCQVWRVQVGRVPLFLLDANVVGNHPDDRQITAKLYGGGPEDRLKQEVLLGIGGVRALEALGLVPTVLHLNEGHAVFAALERCRKLTTEAHLNFTEALFAVASTTCFTTHTPVPAGNQIYPLELIGRYFHNYWPDLRLTDQGFFALGRQNPFDTSEAFGMTVCALRVSQFRNGVSELHGHVSRNMWQRVWPEVPAQEVPITHITNGVHLSTWASQEFAALFNRYLGPRWIVQTADADVWARVQRIPAAELWHAHERRREQLVAYARIRLRHQLKRRGASSAEIERAAQMLDPKALTIGFARRFATYKRAFLIFRDLERLARLLVSRDMPMQIIISGKAHPRDEPGKRVIQQVAKLIQRQDMQRHIVLLEDYDMGVASYLVQGCDVWLNNPRRPQEASGTSGMKAVVNGVLHCSTLDGWWVEAYTGDNGWAIGNGEEYAPAEHEHQDDVESRHLLTLLEQEIVPLFYDRGPDGIPRGWVERMKKAMSTICPKFNSNRQVMDYTEKFYLPGQERWSLLMENSYAATRQVGDYFEKLRQTWDRLQITDVTLSAQSEVLLGSEVTVEATVNLGGLKPEHVVVEICEGRVNENEQMAVISETVPMKVVAALGEDQYRMRGVVIGKPTGRIGVAIRILPKHQHLLPNDRLPGYIRWA